MPSELSYDRVMSRQSQIVRAATGIDYGAVRLGSVAFDTESLLAEVAPDLEAVRRIQERTGVGGTPLLELPNLTAVIRRVAGPGRGARLFVKDEAANPSGSFKDRRASVSVHAAKEGGYPGVAAMSSGNFGAGVASQAARVGLPAIIVQEVFDSRGAAQPEILEKTRKCEALGAEVIQTSVGPELFYMLLRVLEETGYFNASLYVPSGIRGIETLGAEIVEQVVARTGREPDAIVCAHAGGGMVSGTARGARAAGAARTRIIGASVDLSGLHMASDRDFNRKSFTTAHTGFAMPFTTWPDRVDVPHSAARPLRYLDRFVTVTQGEVFYTTELLARCEGLERGPAGNTSLAAAIPIAAEMDQNQVIVVSETEYTAVGKSPAAQLAFAESRGVRIVNGTAEDDRPGEIIALPVRLEDLRVRDVNLDGLRASFVRQAASRAHDGLNEADLAFIAAETGWSTERVEQELAALAAA